MDIYLVSFLIVFIPFVIGLVLFKYFSTELRIFFLFVACGVLYESLAAFTVKVIGVNNNVPLSHFFGIITFLIISFFYRRLLGGFVKQKWVDTIIAFFTVYYLINSLFLQSIYKYPGIAVAIGTIIILFLIILYFARVMQEAKIRNLFAVPEIWISAALLIYYAYNLFYFILFNLIIDFSMEFAVSVTYYRVVVNVLVYTLISTGFVKQQKWQIEKNNMVV